MKAKVASPRRLNILGNGDWLSGQEILSAMLKQWRQKLGYCSIFAAFPAILAWHVPEAGSDIAKETEATIAGRGATLLESLNMSCSNPGLLKRQSEYLLPHQKGSFDILAPLVGNDDCPGRTIPGGNYTAAAPYIDSGDTTGANNTVTRAGRVGFYCYLYSYDFPGSDHVYSFTLTGLGANPQIQISRTSGTYEPKAYILDSRFGGCRTGNERCSLIAVSEFSTGSTATIPSQQMNFLPLNVPLHLFVDSAREDASGSGPYTLRIQDVTIAPAGCPNPNLIDCPEIFVRQHYLDFLNREPDQGGWDYWSNQITSCPPGDQHCINARRIRVSDAFFFEPEFQQTGSYVLRLYRAAYGNNQPLPNPDPGDPAAPFYPGPNFHLKFPSYTVFTQDRAQIDASSPTTLTQSQLALANAFVGRPEFLTKYPASLTGPDFVNALLATINSASGVDLTPQSGTLNSLYNQGGRGLVMFHLANDYWNGCGPGMPAPCVPPSVGPAVDNRPFIDAEYNLIFVTTEYFGYLRRDGDANGLNFWLIEQVNRFPLRDIGIQHAMVCSFITSAEYQLRFGSAVTHTNAECPH